LPKRREVISHQPSISILTRPFLCMFAGSRWCVRSGRAGFCVVVAWHCPDCGWRLCSFLMQREEGRREKRLFTPVRFTFVVE
jgi:hypothetical protein